MKNSLADAAIKRIADVLEKVFSEYDQTEHSKIENNAKWSEFDKAGFINLALENIDTLELKQRVNHIISVLHRFLPSDFNQTATVLLQVKKHWDHDYKSNNPNENFSIFAAWPIIDYVGVHGLEHPEQSLAVLKKLTSLFSAEFSIRPFIVKYPEYCQAQFLAWTKDECEHVRRLVSEGTRPRLPWGLQLKKFIDDPSPNLPLLDKLKADSSLYVRRSVANHLNDIAKDHPTVVINTCKAWQQAQPKNAHLQWLIKHASRSLVKAGNSGALSLLGFTENPKVSVTKLELSSTEIARNGSIGFTFELRSLAEDIQKSQKLVVDYALYFVKANGQQKPKVFKLKNLNLATQEQIALSKNYSFKPISTRKYYPGEHKIEILVNGQALASTNFILN